MQNYSRPPSSAVPVLKALGVRMRIPGSGTKAVGCWIPGIGPGDAGLRAVERCRIEGRRYRPQGFRDQWCWGSWLGLEGFTV